MPKTKLVQAVTEYDRKQQTKKHYNRFALSQYFARIEEVAADIERGANVRQAIIAGFTGRLLDVCLKAAGEPKATEAELRSKGSWGYCPVTK